MTVGILIVAHGELGSAMVRTAMHMLGNSPFDVRIVSVAQQCDPDQILDQATRLRADLDKGQGVLVLTDMYGSTPSNIASRLEVTEHVRVIAGINIPMLLRIFNYPELSLDELCEKAVSGGRDGIVPCTWSARSE